MSLETVLVYKKRARSNGARPVTAAGAESTPLVLYGCHGCRVAQPAPTRARLKKARAVQADVRARRG